MSAIEPIDIHRVTWSGMTDVGRFRKNNEDAFLALAVDADGVYHLGKEGHASLECSDYIFAVSDGMGGANAGEFASKIAVQMILDLIVRKFRPSVPNFRRGSIDLLGELFDRIHAEMRSMGQHYSECAGMGATLSLCWVTPQRTHFAHIGDSRIYYLPGEGSIRQITEDHSHVGWLLRSGQISEFEARNHPRRNELHQVLGGKAKTIEPQFGNVIPQANDMLVLCSDGISDAISNRTIENMLHTPPNRVAGRTMSGRLVQEAKEESGRDNLTALVVQIDALNAPAAEGDVHN